MELRCPITFKCKLSFLKFQPMSGHELLQALEERLLACHICEGHVYLEHICIKLLNKALLLHYISDISTAEQPVICCDVIIERLCSELISQAEIPVIFCIVKSKREHSVNMVSHAFVPFFIGTYYYGFLSFFSGKCIIYTELPAKLSPVTDMSSVIAYFYQLNSPRKVLLIFLHSSADGS